MRLIEKVNYYRYVSLNSGNLQVYFNSLANDLNYMAKTIYHSSKIEGNTITYADTLSFLKSAIPITEMYHKYTAKETQEHIGLLEATKLMYSQVGKPLTVQFILNLRKLLYSRVEDAHKGIYAGEYRKYASFTRRSDTGQIKHYENWRTIEDSMEDMVFLYNNSNKNLYDICELKLTFIHIHPFGDGNGRLSRLLLNWALLSSQYLPIIIKEQDRKKYIATLNVYGDKGESSLFTKFVVEYLLEGYRKIL